MDPADPVVVIGAGILGCSTAYHLLRSGARNVTVVDRNEPAGGTTAAGAGFVALWAAGMYNGGKSAFDLEQYSLDFYRRLYEDGHDFGYRNDGNLVLALTEEKWQNTVRPLARHPLASPATRTLGPAEVAEITGVIDAREVAGGVLMPSGVQVETGAAVAALATFITEMGGRIHTGATVEGIEVNGQRVTAVSTTSGVLPAAAVAIAAGAWTNQVLSHLGRRLPLLPVVATRVVTEPCGVPRSMPTIQCREIPVWIRESRGGFTWGTARGYRPAFRLDRQLPVERPRVPELFAAVRADTGRLARVFPGIAQLAVKSWVQGMPVYTPDGQLVLGPVPGFANAVVLGGDNETGVSHGPAMGRVAAELLRGETAFTDISRLRPDRFDRADFPDEESIEAHMAGAVWNTHPAVR